MSKPDKTTGLPKTIFTCLGSLIENRQSTGSRRCSESNSKSFPKWRKKIQLTEITNVNEVPTVQHKHWVNAKENQNSRLENYYSIKKSVLCLRYHGTCEEGSVKGIPGESQEKFRLLLQVPTSFHKFIPSRRKAIPVSDKAPSALAIR